MAAGKRPARSEHQLPPRRSPRARSCAWVLGCKLPQAFGMGPTTPSVLCHSLTGLHAQPLMEVIPRKAFLPPPLLLGDPCQGS